MNSTDLVTMIGNLSRSLFSVQSLLTGLAYVIGMLFIMMALSKFNKIAVKGSYERMLVPIAYILGGSVLLFLPSAYTVLSNTVFGANNILSYAKYNPYDIYSSMGLLIQTAGIIWFIRGCVLLVGASEPQVKHGSKGLLFLFAGVLAMNFQSTIAALNSAMEGLESLTLTIKTTQGY
ncbi:MAG: type IV secretion protein IcmC [Tatlockia sp.]|jgi:hypothetical protein